MELSEQEQRAQRAAKAGKRLLPQLTRFCRAISRNPKLKVKLSADMSATDGSTMYLRIPIELGDLHEHVRRDCGKYDDEGFPLCAACAAREELDLVIFHEPGHILSKSFARMSAREIEKTIDSAIAERYPSSPKGSRAEKLRRRLHTFVIEYNKAHGDMRYFDMANVVSEFLVPLMNAAEDVRVNRDIMEQRPGLEPLFWNNVIRTFRDGTLQMDGELARWTDRPLNSQAIVGVFFKAGGYTAHPGWEDFFAPEVVEALGDSVIEGLLDQVAESQSVREVSVISFKLLERFRELGFLVNTHEDPEDDESPADAPPPPESGTGEPDESDDSDGSDDSDDEGDQDGEGSGQDDHDGEGSDEGDQDGEGSGQGDEDEEDGTGEGDTPADADSSDSDGDAADSGDGSGGKPSSSPSTGPAKPLTGKPGTGEMGTGAEALEDLGAATGHDEVPMEQPKDVDFKALDPTTAVQEDLKPNPPVKPMKAGIPSEDGEQADGDGPSDEDAMRFTLAQLEHFEATSRIIKGVRFHEFGGDQSDDTGEYYGRSGGAWRRHSYRNTEDMGSENEPIAEALLAPALRTLRRTFADNQRARHERNLRRGPRLNGRVLGMRIPDEDDRIFTRKGVPGKKSYFVVIGIDVSGSTGASLRSRTGEDTRRIKLLKEAALAQAQLCKRVGVDFAVYAHSGSHDMVDMYVVKGPNDPWGPHQIEALRALGPDSANLDGHTLEQYRRVCDGRTEETKIILYYTDGAMPMENYDEELEILQREIATCTKKGYILVGIGVGTDSPSAHGLETVRIDSLDEVPVVVEGLRNKLLGLPMVSST